jgi:AraC-like DNA-binding protein
MNELHYIIKNGVHNLHYDFGESKCELLILLNQRIEPLHVHDFDELAVIFGGSAIHVIDDQEYPVVRGDVFVVRGNHQHTFKSLNNLNIANIIFKRDYFENLKKEFNNLPGFKALFVDEPLYRKNQKFKSKLHLNSSQLQEIVHLLNGIRDEQADILPGYNEAKERIFEFIIIKICRDFSEKQTPKTKSLIRISKAIDFMENNYEQQITINLLARKTSMSESNFSYCFKKVTGLSPRDFLINLRVEKAIDFMTVNSNVNVTETAMKTGFYDSAYFSKKFKKIVGITPMAFLKKQHEKVE